MSEKVLLLINLHVFKVERALSCDYLPFNYSESIGCVRWRGCSPSRIFQCVEGYFYFAQLLMAILP